MKKKDVKISSFQAENYRLQLLYVTKEYKNGIINTGYEIHENRKIVYKHYIFAKVLEIYRVCITNKLNKEFVEYIQINTI